MFERLKQNPVGWILYFAMAISVLQVYSCSEKGLVDPTDPDNTFKIGSISSSVTSILMGGEQTAVSVLVTNRLNKPAVARTVAFEAQLGSITSSVVSDSLGIASATYTSGATIGTDTITVTLTNDDATTVTSKITIEVLFRTDLTIFTTASSLLADGSETAELNIVYLDASGDPLSEQTVTLFTDLGTIAESVTTDFLGRAKTTYTAPAFSSDSVATIFATVLNPPTGGGSALKKSNAAISSNNDRKDVIDNDEKVTDTELKTDKIVDETQNEALAKAVEAKVDVADTIQISLTGVRLALAALDDSISASGTTQTTVTAQLATTAGQPLVSRQINFATNFGTLISSTAVTGNQGVASVQLRSPTETGVATITATFAGTIIAKTFVSFVAGGQESFSISVRSNPTQIDADGVSSSTITAILTNAQNNPIANETISFSTDLGRVAGEATTDNIGVATAALFSARENGVATVTARFQGIARTTQVAFSGVSIALTANPDRVVADGVSKSEISLVMTDASGIPIESREVQLTASSGTFENDSTWIRGITDVNGVFADSIKSIDGGVVTLTAEGGGTTTSTTLSFTNFTTTLTADSSSITANDSVRLIFKIVDLDGVGQAGINVVFFSTLGSVNPTDGVTDADGNVETYLKSSVGGSATVTASVVSAGIIAPSASAQVTISSTPPASVKLIVDPIVIPVNGGKANLTAIVTDDNGNPVPGKIVSFNIVASPGGGETLDPPFATTDQTGSAKTVFTSGSLGSQTVNSVVFRASLQEFTLSAEANLTIAGEPNEINTSSSPPPVDNGDGTFSLTLGSIVSDINGNAVVDGTLVHFATIPPVGVINSPVVTQGGIVATTLTYPIDSAGDSLIVVTTSGQINDTLVISQLPTSGVAGFVDDIQFQGASSSSILGDGDDQTTFDVLVLDNTNNPIGGVIVNFESDPGNSGSGLTQEELLGDGTQNPNWGIASLAIKSVSLGSDVFPEITVRAGGVTKIFQANNVADPQVPFSFLGINLAIESDKDTISVNESMNVTVVLKESTSNIALDGRIVRFGSGLGLISNQGVTNSQGQIVLPFTSGTVSGSTTITATFGTGISASKTIFVAPETLTNVTNIFLSADTSAISVQGTSGLQSTAITAQLTNANNNPVGPGFAVTLTSSAVAVFASTGTNTVNLVTDDEGKVVGQLQSTATSGIATITATSGTVSVTKDLVVIQAGKPNAVIVTADTLGTIAGGGLLQINVAAIITDVNGNPVATGSSVSFTVTDDNGNPADDPIVSIVSFATTDEQGIARTTLSYVLSEINKTLRIVATSGGITGSIDISLPDSQ